MGRLWQRFRDWLLLLAPPPRTAHDIKRGAARLVQNEIDAAERQFELKVALVSLTGKLLACATFVVSLFIYANMMTAIAQPVASEVGGKTTIVTIKGLEFLTSWLPTILAGLFGLSFFEVLRRKKANERSLGKQRREIERTLESEIARANRAEADQASGNKRTVRAEEELAAAKDRATQAEAELEAVLVEFDKMKTEFTAAVEAGNRAERERDCEFKE